MSVYTIAETPESLVPKIMPVCEHFLERFLEIRRGWDFNAISRPLYEVLKLARRAEVLGIKSADRWIFDASQKLCHARCYIDVHGILLQNTSGALLEMSRVALAHPELRLAYLAQLGDVEKIEAGNDVLKQTAVLKDYLDLRKLSQKGEWLPYYLLRTIATLAGRADMSDDAFDNLMKKVEDDLYNSGQTLHQIAHVRDGMCTGYALRFEKCRAEGRGGHWYNDLAVDAIHKTIAANDLAEEVLGRFDEYWLRKEQLSVSLCRAGIYDHLPPVKGMPSKDRLEMEVRRVQKVARDYGSHRIETQMLKLLPEFRAVHSSLSS